MSLCYEILLNVTSEHTFLQVVTLKETNEIIGMIDVISKNIQYMTAEVGYCYGSKYWGKGYAFEAAEKVLDFAFRELNLKEIYAFTSILNKKSYTLMKRLGMKNTKNNFSHPLVPLKHRLSEHLLYKITNQEYKKEKK